MIWDLFLFFFFLSSIHIFIISMGYLSFYFRISLVIWDLLSFFFLIPLSTPPHPHLALPLSIQLTLEVWDIY